MPTDQAEIKSANAALGYFVAQYSPVLAASEKIAISQDFNGAPLTGRPRRHTVSAAKVSCISVEPNSSPTSCTVAYTSGHPAVIKGKDAKLLFDALDSLGARDVKLSGHLERALTAISCSIDDARAQSTPGTYIDGFNCRFQTPADGAAASADPKPSKVARCLLVVRDKAYIDGPCYYTRLDTLNSGMGKGSFQIAQRDYDGKGAMGYFAQLDVEDTFVSLNWNADPKSFHADALLGEDFKRNGACWLNSVAKVCAWQ